jgi:hypothetical protein
VVILNIFKNREESTASFVRNYVLAIGTPDVLRSRNSYTRGLSICPAQMIGNGGPAAKWTVFKAKSKVSRFLIAILEVRKLETE